MLLKNAARYKEARLGFRGFPKEGLQFFNQLKKHNKREWFQRRKDTYEALLREPMKALVAELSMKVRPVAPELHFDPKKSIFRIYRDVRFSKDKSPYKTHIAASFGRLGRSKDMETPGVYLHIEPKNCFIGGGLYMPNGEQLKKIREYMQRDPKAFYDVVKSPMFKKKFKEIEGEKLKKAPKGFDPDHPMIEYLRYKQFFIWTKYKETDVLKASFANKVTQDIAAMMPFNRWLEKAMKIW